MAVNIKGSGGGGSIKFSGTGGSFRTFNAGGGGGGGPVSPIVPDTLSGLVAWFKADSLSLGDGAAVTYWQDDSPNNNHLDQWDTGGLGYVGDNIYQLAPKYNSADPLLNNMPSVSYGNAQTLRGGGVSYNANVCNYKTNPTGLPTGDQPSTMYVVGYWDGMFRVDGYDQTWNRGLFGWGNNSGPGKRLGVNMLQGGLFADCWGGATTLRPMSHEAPFIFSFPYSSGGFASKSSYLNGKSMSGNYQGTATGSPDIPASSIELAIGRIPTVAASQHRWTGAISEVILFNEAHDAATRRGIEKYLSDKYGIPVVNEADITPPRTNLVGWWRIDTAGKFVDGQPFHANPFAPGLVTDHSDWGRHLEGGNTPTYEASDPDMNNQRTLIFNPANYQTRIRSTPTYSNDSLPEGNPALTVYMVALANQANNSIPFHWGRRDYWNDGGGVNRNRCFAFAVRDQGGTPYVSIDHFGSSWGGLPITLGEPFVAAWAHTQGADVTADPLYVNGSTGTSIITGTSGSLTLVNSEVNSYIGFAAGPSAGGHGVYGAEGYFDGHIGEALVYAEKHDEATMTSITNYLKTKYGIV
jgi:hypothetical protein